MNTRAHEVCGPSSVSFALALGGQLAGGELAGGQLAGRQSGGGELGGSGGGELGGMVLWVREAWRVDQLNPVGCAPYLDPHRLLLAQAPSHIDVLAVAEEALRSGNVALVVMELSQSIGLTEGRRLQLAAQTGNAMGLCLIPEGAGSNAAQTRWRCSPIFDDATDGVNGVDSTLQRWEIIKNKSGTLAAWDVKWDAQTHRISVVSEIAQR